METSRQTIENVIIIGGGPAGLASAIYTARAKLDPLVFTGTLPGGQLMVTTDVENFPGSPRVSGAGLMKQFRDQAIHFGARIVDTDVKRVDFSKQPLEVYINKSQNSKVKTSSFTKVSEDKQNYKSKSVIIATGAMQLGLDLESEKRLRGRGVSMCAVCDGFFFRDKPVAVVGGGDVALEEALTLSRFATKVYVIHRRDAFRASKIMQERVSQNPKIKVLWNMAVEEVLGKEKVEGVRLKKIAKLLNGSTRLPDGQVANNTTIKQFNNSILPISGLFIAIGRKPSTDIFKGQVNMDERGYIITTIRAGLMGLDMSKYNHEHLFMTSVGGVFATGDCVDYLYRQASTASGMGVAAALDAERWLEGI